MTEILLGVNIDHIATIRNLRNTNYPDLIKAALIAEKAGADSITVHLREDRRHINDSDLYMLHKNVQTKLNLEIAVTEEMIDIACDVKPNSCCLVPENRKELTTEGGLNVVANKDLINNAVKKLSAQGILVSLFVEADYLQITAALESGACCIEIHTGTYSDAINKAQQIMQLNRIIKSIDYATNLGLQVHAGHGLNYDNVRPIAALRGIHELNIGHSIISYATIYGLKIAVKKMKHLLRKASC